MARHRIDPTGWWRIRPRALVALAVASTGLAAAVWLPGRNDVAQAAETRTVFGDDFSGKRGADPDRGRWNVDGRSDGTRLNGSGELSLNRRMTSREVFTAPTGRAEARIKVKRRSGPWRAFAVVAPDGKRLRGDVKTLDRSADETSGREFHRYAVEWSPTEVVWSFDGKQQMRLTRQDVGAPFVLLVNMATQDDGPGPMVVDFIKVSVAAQAPPVTVPPTTSAPAPEPTTPAPTTPPTSEPPTSEPPPATTPPATTPPVTTPPTTTPPPTTAPPTTAPPTTPPPTTPPPTTPPPTTPPATTAPPKPPAAKPWKAFTTYKVGDRVTFEGDTYRVLQNHTALPEWEPTAVPSLFAKE